MNKSKRLADKLAILLSSALLAHTTHGQLSVNVALPAVEIHAESDFYEPLTPYGRWEVVGVYGRCWIPSRVEAEWRPYCNGAWQRTDAGWYWVSDEPWAWATYHYGRWDLSPQYGWYWVPQTQWAPAWVSWHNGGGYVGWAPLNPAARIGGGGFVEVSVGRIAPRAFVFVEERRFLEPVRPTTVVVNNTTIINKTVNITNIKVVNNTVINEGPLTTVIERASGQKVQAVPVHELRGHQEAAVVASQRLTAPTAAAKPQPALGSAAVPPEAKVVPAHEPRPVEKPVVIPCPNAPIAQRPQVEHATVQPIPHPAPAKPVSQQAKPVIEQTKPVPNKAIKRPLEEPQPQPQPQQPPERPVPR